MGYTKMGCCKSIPCCDPICNLFNNVGCEWADTNRKNLSILNTGLAFVALVFACVGTCGLSTSPDVVTSVPWMKYTISGIDVYANIEGFYIDLDGEDFTKWDGKTVCNGTEIDTGDCKNCKKAATGMRTSSIVLVISTFATVAQAMGR